MYEQAMLYTEVFFTQNQYRLVVLYNDFSKLSLVGMQLPENIYYLRIIHRQSWANIVGLCMHGGFTKD
jgi:hypothetical protein